MVDVAEASEQEEKSTKHSAVEVCVDVPRQEPERVCRYPHKCSTTIIQYCNLNKNLCWSLFNLSHLLKY